MLPHGDKFVHCAASVRAQEPAQASFTLPSKHSEEILVAKCHGSRLRFGNASVSKVEVEVTRMFLADLCF